MYITMMERLWKVIDRLLVSINRLSVFVDRLFDSINRLSQIS
ncbi:hypothetical protein [Psychrobacillus sp. FSL H8-0510]